MDAYREALVQTECIYGCPIGRLALELHEPDPPVCERLAEFVLTTMEGGVMLARSYRNIDQLKLLFNRLLRPAKSPASRRLQRRKKGKARA